MTITRLIDVRSVRIDPDQATEPVIIGGIRPTMQRPIVGMPRPLPGVVAQNIIGKATNEESSSK